MNTSRLGGGPRAAIAEMVGTALLLAVVIGSGIMAERLSAGNVALALLANSLATGAGLSAIILAFEPVSGAHFNPAVTFFEAVRGTFRWSAVPIYIAAQCTGALLGAVVAHVMFGEPVLSFSTHPRVGTGQLLGEATATFGLMCVIRGAQHGRAKSAAFAVGGYITAAYWFTSSTSFANPAVTLARSFSNTFAGIRSVDALPFIFAQLVGAGAATLLWSYLEGSTERTPGASAAEKEKQVAR